MSGFLYFIDVFLKKTEVRSPKTEVRRPKTEAEVRRTKLSNFRLPASVFYSLTIAPRLLKSSKKPGYDFATHWESLIYTLPEAPSAATANAIAIR